MKKPSAFQLFTRINSPAARFFAGAIAALFAAQSASAATTHTWVAGDFPNTNSWSTPLNWSDNATQTFVAGDTFDLSTLDITADSISTVDASATLGIIKIGDSTTSTNAWTLNNSGGATLTLDNGASSAQINQTSTSFGDTISVPLLLNSDLLVTNNSASALTLGGDISILGGTGSKNLTLSGAGTLVLKGNNVTNPGAATRGGNLTVTGGGTLKITAGLTNALPGSNTNREGGQMLVGTSTSGGNHLEITGAGKAKSGSMLVGQGTSGSSLYGSNTVVISTPGNSGSPSYLTGTNGGNYYIGVYSQHNSLTVSNGAYITQSNGGGTANSYVGQYLGADYNSMTLTDANTKLAHSGQRLYVGGDGSHNSLLVKAGAQVTSALRILQIGGNTSTVAATDNSVTVTNANSIVNASQQFFVGLTANSTNNSMLISDGGSFIASINGSSRCIIGAAAGASNNSLTVTGALSTLTISTGVVNAQVTLACNTSDASVAADGNHLDVLSGATASLSIPVKLGGTNSKFNLGDGTGTSTAQIGLPASTLGYLVNLASADAQLNINGGKLVALAGGIPMVTGTGTVNLNGPAIFDSGTGAFANSIGCIISGTGSLTKAGGDTSTLTLAAGTNTYSGDTNLVGGILVLTSPNPNNETAAVTIDTSHSILNLNFVGDDVVGSLVINGVTMAAGTYGSSSSPAPSANQLDNAFAGTGTLTVSGAAPSPTYAKWASSNGIPGAPANGDADNDGVPNAVEMVLGGNPNGGMDAALLPQLALVSNPDGVPAGDYMEFTFRRTDLSVGAGVTAACEYGTDLASAWTTAVDGVDGVTVLVDNDYAPYGTATARVRVYVPRGANARLFGRLHVTVP